LKGGERSGVNSRIHTPLPCVWIYILCTLLLSLCLSWRCSRWLYCALSCDGDVRLINRSASLVLYHIYYVTCCVILRHV